MLNEQRFAGMSMTMATVIDTPLRLYGYDYDNVHKNGGNNGDLDDDNNNV